MSVIKIIDRNQKNKNDFNEVMKFAQLPTPTPFPPPIKTILHPQHPTPTTHQSFPFTAPNELTPHPPNLINPTNLPTPQTNPTNHLYLTKH